MALQVFSHRLTTDAEFNGANSLHISLYQLMLMNELMAEDRYLWAFLEALVTLDRVQLLKGSVFTIKLIPEKVPYKTFWQPITILQRDSYL